jgi:hypothetical protein
MYRCIDPRFLDLIHGGGGGGSSSSSSSNMMHKKLSLCLVEHNATKMHGLVDV